MNPLARSLIDLSLGCAALAVCALASAQSQQARQPQGRPAIELTPAERQAIDEAALKAVRPASLEQALQPKAEPTETVDDLSPRITQHRRSNRVAEVTVTPANTNRSYVMINREDRQPLSVTQMSSGLSVPMFFRFEFGGSAPPRVADPPTPPPAAR